MKEVTVSEARAHLSRLIAAAERGETVTITRRGRPVARLVPARDEKRVADAIDAMKEFRKGHTLGDVSIRDLINEGRRR
jgi:prevent-host-death family protein